MENCVFGLAPMILMPARGFPEDGIKMGYRERRRRVFLFSVVGGSDGTEVNSSFSSFNNGNFEKVSCSGAVRDHETSGSTKFQFVRLQVVYAPINRISSTDNLAPTLPFPNLPPAVPSRRAADPYPPRSLPIIQIKHSLFYEP
ncbi:hypothetical protein GWI33_008280 [Rhynchophorus ferrugineus]|uniref:Uncharacterized protein n=1 Tax=Rhynchophorus ferrugineus TaxID=354439 RepID=A0A834MKQ7_RHYFE|nr:hypothetical protein GWI33_008280 [Rhynchophorus ferrugineus]